MKMKFLLLISQRRMKEALPLCRRILSFEPSNKMILDYKHSIEEYISQGNSEKLLVVYT